MRGPLLATVPSVGDPWMPLRDLSALVYREAPAGTELRVSIEGEHFSVDASGAVARETKPAFSSFGCGGMRPAALLEVTAWNADDDLEHFGGLLDGLDPAESHQKGLFPLDISVSGALEARGDAVAQAAALFATTAGIIGARHSYPGWWSRSRAAVTSGLLESGAEHVGTQVELLLPLQGFDDDAALAAAPPARSDGVCVVRIDELERVRPQLRAELLALIQQTWADIALAGRFVAPAGHDLTRWLSEPLSARTSAVALGSDGAVIGASILDVIPADPAAEARNLPEGTFGSGKLTVLRREWRGRGLGRALKASSCAWAKRDGVDEVETSTALDGAMEHVARSLGFIENEGGRLDLLELRSK